MREINLAGGKGIALVDDQDFELVSKYKWYLSKSPNGNSYARTRFKDRTSSSMHRLIIGIV